MSDFDPWQKNCERANGVVWNCTRTGLWEAAEPGKGEQGCCRTWGPSWGSVSDSPPHWHPWHQPSTLRSLGSSWHLHGKTGDTLPGKAVKWIGVLCQLTPSLTQQVCLCVHTWDSALSSVLALTNNVTLRKSFHQGGLSFALNKKKNQ